MSAEAPENKNVPNTDTILPPKLPGELPDFADQEGLLNVSELAGRAGEVLTIAFDASKVALTGLRIHASDRLRDHHLDHAVRLSTEQERTEHVAQAAYAGITPVEGGKAVSRREKRAALRASKRANKVVASKMRQLQTATFGTTDANGYRLKDPVTDSTGNVQTKPKTYTWTNPDGSRGGVTRLDVPVMEPRPSDVGTDAQLQRIQGTDYDRQWRRAEKKARRRHIREGSRQFGVFGSHDRVSNGRDIASMINGVRGSIHHYDAADRKGYALRQKREDQQDQLRQDLGTRRIRVRAQRRERAQRRRERRDRVIRETMSGF